MIAFVRDCTYYVLPKTIKTLTMTRLKCIIGRSIFVIFPLPRTKKEMISWCTFRSLVKKNFSVYLKQHVKICILCVISSQAELRKPFYLGPFLYYVSKKTGRVDGWSGGFCKWPFLLTFSTVFMLI